MKQNVEEYFSYLRNKYPNKVRIETKDINAEKLKSVPKALHSLYNEMSKAILPYGEIFSIEEALEQSKRNPFKPKWFVFGKDRYFTFWLCSYEEDAEGLSFTYWDHESGNEIEEAVWKDVISFLQEIEEENREF